MKKRCLFLGIVCISYANLWIQSPVQAEEVTSEAAVRVTGELVLEEVPNFNFGIAEKGKNIGRISGTVRISDDRVIQRGWTLQVKEDGNFTDNGLTLFLTWSGYESGYEYSVEGFEVSENYEPFISASNEITSEEYSKEFNLNAGVMVSLDASSGNKNTVLTWNLVNAPNE